MEEIESLLVNVLELMKEYKITAYEIERNTGLSAVGVQKIINGETKRPQPNTLNTIMEYINGKYINVKISKSNLYAGGKHKINQGGVYNDGENTKELISDLMNMIREKDIQISKKDEQIQQLLQIIAGKS
ncbi:helix-turn-helix domain-containing protein [Capnocytophaga genosp. AHN8471]|jgi:hypothetical protein|uniref:HTH cro/C1-type domain-containing protein n=1 Tax=Capnocytophaga endodontalis TaxID=2708117 RepID=A0A1Z4BQ34_9FLAO|nr:MULTISPECIES: helix-turn-helix transcriptional regulator [Capnocytophaga]ASF43368.1 hypothetical protein CBG49_09965 [Capnocytophaga endodontalis]MBM0654601.1 helix-turn-helix domain-containing protein [Capnocytophaga genosp. AHN8471]MBM0655586.1 helix-turn-helix domain-containing protein [Capnocytophaga genosp. AHN8471]